MGARLPGLVPASEAAGQGRIDTFTNAGVRS
jgi:hypothetical protein